MNSWDEFIESAQEFFYGSFLVFDNLLQFIIILAAFAFAWALSRTLRPLLNAKFTPHRYLSVIHNHFSVSRKELLLWSSFALLLSIIALILPLMEISSRLVAAAANLTVAWLVIRISSGVIRSNFLSKIFAISVFLIAALNILHWLDPVIAALDSQGITIGKVHVTPYLIIKGTLIFAILLWLARLLSTVSERALTKFEGLTPSHIVLFNKLICIALLSLAILVGLNIVGIDLTALAVFSGAIGIGIGFGMQKVFGNLVSGFILLMDRSIKPGDIIAIGDTYGWVNRLGARYVSILTRDGKEHLIPNENLITQQVENWSYSDTKIRVHIPVGVSYNSDIHLVKKLLLESITKNPRILKSPQPVCLLKDYGDNSVNFEIRAWINDPANGIGNIRSMVYFDIWDVFKQHGIEFPFPQRDVHIKSIPNDLGIKRPEHQDQGSGSKDDDNG